MDDNGAKKVCLDEIFGTDNHYRIPNYQRPYSWTANEAGTLYDDILEAWEASTTVKEAYFLGSIVLAHDGKNQYEVIDGQQRLTTISLLLAALYSCCGDDKVKAEIDRYLIQRQSLIKKIEEVPRIAVRDRDIEFYKKYVLNYQFEELFKQDASSFDDDAKRLLQGNEKLFVDSIHKDFTNDKSILEFVTYLMTQCYLVRIVTEDEAEAFRIFSVLNNRGLSLLPSDIIKSELIGSIEKSKRDYYTLRWEELENRIGRDHFNAFLSYIRMIVAKSKLRNTLVDDFKKLVIAKRTGIDVFEETIEPYGEIFLLINNANTDKKYIDTCLYWLNRVDDNDWVPVALAAFKSYRDDNEFLEAVFSELERLAAYMFLSSKSSNVRIARYAKILNEIEKLNKDGILENLALSTVEQEEFITILDGDIYNLPPRKRSYVVARLNSFIASGSLEFKYKDFTIEHVLPQEPSSSWIKDWPDLADRQKWTNRIANLIPLTRRKNSQASNDSFASKKEKYFTTLFGVTEFPLSTQIIKYDSWTPDILRERQKQLLNVYIAYWKLGQSIMVKDALEALPQNDAADLERQNTEKKTKIEKEQATVQTLQLIERLLHRKFVPATTRKDNSQFYTLDRNTMLLLSFSKYGKDYYYTFRGNVLKQLVDAPQSYVVLGFGQAERLFMLNKKALIDLLSIDPGNVSASDRCDIHIKRLSSGEWELHRSNYEKRAVIDPFEILKQ